MTFFTSSRPLQQQKFSRQSKYASSHIGSQRTLFPPRHPFPSTRTLITSTSSASEGAALPPSTHQPTYDNVDPSTGTENIDSTSSIDPRVAEALEKVQAAIATAEEGLQQIHLLQSARLPNIWDNILHASKPTLQVLSVISYCYIIHAFNIAASQIVGALLLAVAIAAWGYQKGSLSPSGAVAAMLVGWTILASSFRGGMVLLAFFFTSSKLTSFKDEDKAVEEDHKSGGYRDWKQVASNGVIPALLAVAAAAITGRMDLPVRSASHNALSAMYAAFLGYYACCCGDTWASELGQLSTEEPRLITTLRPVRKGTNGGVTLLGLAASIMGGLFVGVIFYVSGMVSPSASGYTYHHHNIGVGGLPQWALVLLGVFAGLLGSLLDSLLGATIQFTGYNRSTGLLTSTMSEKVTPISGIAILDNNMVNAVSASITCVVCGAIGGFVF